MSSTSPARSARTTATDPWTGVANPDRVQVDADGRPCPAPRPRG